MKRIKIRILTSLATMTRTYERNDIAEWDEADAQRLFAAGYAEPYTDAASTKTSKG